MKIAFLGFGGIGQETLNMLLHSAKLRDHFDEIVIICRNVEKYSAFCEDIVDGLLTEYIFSGQDRIKLPSIVISDDYQNIKGSKILICCYGVPSTFPMQDRHFLLDDHIELSNKIFKQASPFITSDSYVINAVNPVDSISYYIDKVLLNSRCSVVGIGATHNTARLLKSICRISKLDMQSIDAKSLMVCGEHGTKLIPLLSKVKTDKGLLIDVIPSANILQIIEDTCNQGLDIFHKMQRPPKYGPAVSILTFLERITQRSKKPCCGSIWIQELEVFMSWPLALCDKGFLPLPISTSQEEYERITQAALKLKTIIEDLH